MAKLKISILSAVVVASVATPLVLQYQARARLREQDDALRQQQSQVAALQAERERLSKVTAGRASSSSQLDDLHRLSAEAAALQQQTNAVAKLREENRQLTAAAAKPQTPLQTREEVMTRMIQGKHWMYAFREYAEKHGEQFPTDFEQAKAFLPQPHDADLKASADQFEIVYHGKWTDLKDVGEVVILREKQAHQMPDGKWGKTYAFADGHSQLHAEPDGNFEAWEKKHIVAPPAPER